MPYRIPKVVAALVLLLGVPAAHAQITDLLRSVTGIVKGNNAPPPKPQQGSTAVIGVRGMDEGGTVAQSGDGKGSQDNQTLDGWQATPPEAQRHAKNKGLAERQVSLVARP